MKPFLFGVSIGKLIMIAAGWLASMICAGCGSSDAAILPAVFDSGYLRARIAIIDADSATFVPELPDDLQNKQGDAPETSPAAVEPTEPPATVPDPPQPGGTVGKSLSGPVESTPVPPAIKIRVYTMLNCPACDNMKRELSGAVLQQPEDPRRFEFLFMSSAPAWTMGHGFPVLHFEASPGQWRTIDGWVNRWDFFAKYDKAVSRSQALATGEAAHTPMAEVVRVIGLLPKPAIAFVDFGCGYDARWCVAAAERWGCKCVGIEIDPSRANAARERVRNLGLDHLITILEGDAGTVPVSGDVAVAYLYPSVLARLKPRLESFKVVASYLHQPPGINCTKNGDTWFCRRQVQQVQQYSAPQGAVWQGMVYDQPVCNSPHCAMCNAIRRQLGMRR